MFVICDKASVWILYDPVYCSLQDICMFFHVYSFMCGSSTGAWLLWCVYLLHVTRHQKGGPLNLSPQMSMWCRNKYTGGKEFDRHSWGILQKYYWNITINLFKKTVHRYIPLMIQKEIKKSQRNKEEVSGLLMYFHASPTNTHLLRQITDTAELHCDWTLAYCIQQNSAGKTFHGKWARTTSFFTITHTC